MTDPNLELCADCHVTRENHWPIRVSGGSGLEEVRRYCEEPPDNVTEEWLEAAPTFRSETREDRTAGWATAHGR